VAAVAAVLGGSSHRYSFNGNGSALSAGATGYLTVPFACTISAWNMSVTREPRGWTSGSYRLALPFELWQFDHRIRHASDQHRHLDSLDDASGWTTAVATNDIVGMKLSAVASATFVNLTVECDQ